MKLINYCILFLLLIASTSCRKKEYPESTIEGAPVFSCSMNINGAPTSFQAGINNYYMYSSFQQDSNNVYGFIAGLKQNNCNNCPNSIQIIINDFKTSPINASAQIDSSLMPGNYNYFLSAASSFYTAQFQSSYNKSAASYLWNFGDGSTSSLQNPSHVYKKNKKYNVSLTVNGTNGCVSSMTDIQNISYLNTGFRATIVDSGSTGNGVYFSANVLQGSGNYSYLWNFGDVSATSSASNPFHAYQYSGSYPVSLRAIDITNNDTSYAKYNVVTQNDGSSCAANYTLSSVNLSPNTLGLANIIIKWTGANGVLYSSVNPLQPANSYFTILSVNDYQNNDNNQATKKLHVKFRCTVYNGTNSIQLDNADAIINVAYK